MNNLKPTNTENKLDSETFGRLASLASNRPVWIRVGQLIDGLSDLVISEADVVFDARQILGVSSSEHRVDLRPWMENQSEPDAVLPDWTLLPCLVEAHAHLFLDGAPIDFQQRKQYLQQSSGAFIDRARARWPKILQCGVGTVRDAGDKHGVGLALAAEAKSRHGRLATTPWIDSPGAAIHHQGRYGSFMGRPIEEFESPAECVSERISAGADRIKLLVTGIIDFKTGSVKTKPQMSPAEVGALVDASKQRSRQTFAHASGVEGVENAIEGGVTTVEHGFFITNEQLSKMRDKQIAWVPTFAPVQLQLDRAEEIGWDKQVVGHLQNILDGHSRMLCKARELGVVILAGSDAGSCGVPHGMGLLNELCHMEAAGLSSHEVLLSATGRSASTLQFLEPIGRIAPGCRARMIFTHHNPLATVANLKLSNTILFDGAVFSRGEDFDTSGL